MERISQEYKKTKIGLVPKNWEFIKIDKILQKVSKSVEVKNEELYQQIGIRSHGKGIFYKEQISGEALGNKSVFWIEPNSFIVNIVFAWEQAIARTTNNEIGMIASHRFPMYQPKNQRVNIDYLVYLFKSPRGKYLLELSSPGGAGRNKTLGQKEFAELTIPLPPLKEQEKIVEILAMWDNVILNQTELIKLKKDKKKAFSQFLLNNSNKETWEFRKLGDLVEYEQPTKYLVSSTNYDDSYEIPVLTAGKTFILGYTNEKNGIFENNLPVIIFDDFTTANKFVDFPFKAKSSAMKILRSKNNSVNMKLVYELMQMINFVSDDHKRYWISEYQELEVRIPPINEQNKIMEILELADREIKLLESELFEVKEQKKGLMQKLLTGEARVKI